VPRSLFFCYHIREYIHSKLYCMYYVVHDTHENAIFFSLSLCSCLPCTTTMCVCVCVTQKYAPKCVGTCKYLVATTQKSGHILFQKRSHKYSACVLHEKKIYTFDGEVHTHIHINAYSHYTCVTHTQGFYKSRTLECVTRVDRKKQGARLSAMLSLAPYARHSRVSHHHVVFLRNWKHVLFALE